MDNKLSVVTGANGYVGFALVSELHKRGDIIRLSLHHKCEYFDKYDNCEVILGDICDPDHLAEVFEGADTVYHVAGVVDITGEKDDLVWKVNYEGTKNVVAACKKCGVKNLVYVSSAGLRVLLSAQKTMNKQGNMIIRNANEEVMEIFEVTGFIDILNIEE